MIIAEHTSLSITNRIKKMPSIENLSEIASILSFIVTFLALIVAICTLRNKIGVKLTQAYTPQEFPSVLAQKIIDIPVTNHKDKAVTIREVFIVIPKIDLKLPIPPFTIEPYGTTVIKFDLYDIYAFKPNLKFSYDDPCSTPTIQVMTNVVGEHFASKSVAKYIEKIKSGQFSLEVNTELKRKKVKHKTIKETNRLLFSVISKEEAAAEAVDNWLSGGEFEYISDIEKENMKKSIKLTNIISTLSGNPYSLTIQNGKFNIKKENP